MEEMQKQYRHAISIIVPFLDEAESLPELYQQLRSVLTQFSKDSEVIFIDDGSRDRGSKIVEDFTRLDKRIKLITFRKNYGQTAAWAAGIDHAKNDLIVFLDADLQNDPKDIALLVEEIEKGYDVVSGWRKYRRDNFLRRKLPSKIANYLISMITGVRLHDYGCSLKMYKKEILKDVRLYGEMHRFLPAYAAWEGAKITEIPVRHRERRHGQSKYGLVRIFKVLLDLTTVIFLGSFVTKPIYFFGSLGFASLFLGLASFCIVAHRVLILNSKEATPLVFMMTIFFIASLQFTLMGLLAEISVRTYHESRAKPVYRISDRKNL